MVERENVRLLFKSRHVNVRNYNLLSLPQKFMHILLLIQLLKRIYAIKPANQPFKNHEMRKTNKQLEVCLLAACCIMQSFGETSFLLLYDATLSLDKLLVS